MFFFATFSNDIYQQQSAKFSAHCKIMYPSTYDPKQGPIVIAWILVLYHRVMNTSSYDEPVSNQEFILLDEDLWKVLDEALHSNIMVRVVFFSFFVFKFRMQRCALISKIGSWSGSVLFLKILIWEKIEMI